MAKQKIRLLDDDRYPAFVARYQADPLRFAVEVCGVIPSSDQADLYNAMAVPDAKVSVVSGTGTGKSNSFGRIALWHLLAFPYAVYDGKVEIGSNTYIGAPNLQQVADSIWKEMQDAKVAIANGPHSWINQYFQITKTRVYVHGFEEQWFVGRVALAKGQSVGIAGKHRYHQLIIVDEAAGVDDSHFDVIDGTQTQAGNKTLMASQGVRSTGRFYDSHHKLSTKNGGSWTSLRFNSENAPFVKSKWLKERELESGGRDSVEYMIRVLGLFPELTDRFLLGRSEVQRCIGAKPVIGADEAWGNMFIVDVAAGVFRDKTVGTHIRVTGNGDRIDPDPRKVDVVDIPIFSNALDWQEIAGRVFHYTQKLSNCTILVDVGGQGVQFAKMLENLGCPNVVKINWGNPCWKKKNKDRFFNQRAQCSVQAAEAVKDGRITFTNQHVQTLLDESSRLPFYFDERARYHILPKDLMKTEGIPSPDLWDTICMAFIERTNYIVSDESNTGGSAITQGIEAVRAAAADFFADTAERVMGWIDRLFGGRRFNWQLMLKAPLSENADSRSVALC